MNEPCRIELLGGLRVHQGDGVITRFRARKNGALLAYVAYHYNDTPSREVLMEMLWPEVDPNAGRFRLNNALSSLRRQLEAPGVPTGAILIADRFSIRINPTGCTTDVAEFESALRLETRAVTEPERISHLVDAADLYRGDLLSGCYEAWIEPERARLADAYLEALRRLTSLLAQTLEYDRALGYARRLVDADPLREELHRTLMRLYVAVGRPSAARRQYHQLEHLLQEALGATPSAASLELNTQLPQGEEKKQHEPSHQPHQMAADEPPTTERERRTQAHIPSHDAPSVVHLPLQFTRFFGRDKEIGLIHELLASHQLITLSGSGGNGKTRLAVEAARLIAPAFAGGVWFVPLGDLIDARLLPGAIVDALLLTRSPDREPLDQLVEFFNARNTHALVLLDNFEHLLAVDRRKSEDGAAVVRALLERVPSLTCMVTSRQRLDLEGERDLPVPPLATPNNERLGPEELMSYEGVQLFADRAQAIRPDFQVTARNGVSIGVLCDRLEGIPLAIELAAARVQAMTPAQMLNQLEHRFDFLVSRRRDATERHRTLRAAIEWSYRLLSPPLQRFFARLSVFRGGWTPEAAETVYEEPMALDYLAQLQDCSLVTTEESGELMRFRMLETLREFGQEQLSIEEHSLSKRRHAAYYLALAEAAEPHLSGPEQAAWFDSLEPEHDNMRTAIFWAVENKAAEFGIRIGGALRWFWAVRGYIREGRAWLTDILAMVSDSERTPAQGKLLYIAGTFAYYETDYEAAFSLLDKSIVLYSEHEDRQAVARSLGIQGLIRLNQCDYIAAHHLYAQALAIYRELDHKDGIATMIEGLGSVARAQGDFEQATLHFEDALALYRQIKDTRGISVGLNNLGKVALYQDKPRQAETLFEEALAIHQKIDDRRGLAWDMENLGDTALSQNAPEIARSRYEASLAIRRALGDKRGILVCLEGLAGVASLLGRPGRAARLFGAAEAQRDTLSARHFPVDTIGYDRSVAAVREALDATEFAMAWAEGRAMTLEQAIEYALQSAS